MKDVVQKRILFILFFIFMIPSGAGGLRGEAIVDTIPTGLLELQDYKYPVYLFVPDNYVPQKAHPLIVTVPGEGESSEENIQFWLGLARRRSAIVLAAENRRLDDLPYQRDALLIEIKNDILQRYHIDSERVYIVGREGGAHYASYLGIKYPEEFSAASILGGSWDGRFKKLIKPESRPVRQIPFHVVFLHDQAGGYEAARQQAAALDEKGYLVEVRLLESGKTFDELEFKKELLSWMDEKSRSWQDHVRQSKKTFKEKLRQSVKDFFTV